MLERLQKIISRAGIASRRHAEQLILSGAVTVNGRVVTELGTKADAARDHITVGPRTVHLSDAPERYLAFYKPPRVVSTMSDPERRPCLGPYLRGVKGRLFPVGRLEFDSAGLLLLTSDGALASDLMRAADVVPQAWRFKVKGRIAPDSLPEIERAAGVRLRLFRDAPNAWYDAEPSAGGRRRLRLGEALLRHGVLVEKMLRSKFAGVELNGMEAGAMRDLSREEVSSLRRAVAGRRQEPARHTAVPAAAAVPTPAQAAQERPERAALARAVEEWRATHARRPRRAFHPVRGKPPAGGRPGNRAQRNRKRRES